MLPSVDFCGLRLSRLLIGANPFGGFSHQSPARDAEMRAYHTPERIIETWRLAEDDGITGMVTNNETPHVLAALRDYLASGGRLQWIAQLNHRLLPSMEQAIANAVGIGARAAFFHGGVMDNIYSARDEATLRAWVAGARSFGLPIGVAGHSPAVHDWVNSLGLVDFHMVCFFDCGSLHNGKGDHFRLADAFAAAECVRRIEKPCIAYKVMAAGRIDAKMALEFAYENIKPGDVINVGMHRGDKDGMVAENAAIVRELLCPERP